MIVGGLAGVCAEALKEATCHLRSAVKLPFVERWGVCQSYGAGETRNLSRKNECRGKGIILPTLQDQVTHKEWWLASGDVNISGGLDPLLLRIERTKSRKTYTLATDMLGVG